MKISALRKFQTKFEGSPKQGNLEPRPSRPMLESGPEWNQWKSDSARTGEYLDALKHSSLCKDWWIVGCVRTFHPVQGLMSMFDVLKHSSLPHWFFCEWSKARQCCGGSPLLCCLDVLEQSAAHFAWVS